TWSIVVPVHNKAAYTLACLAQLQAVLPAASNAGEIIVVDDASIDDTPGVVGRACAMDPRIRALRNTENQGFLASCNRGASAASGDIVVFLNNDTLPQPGWLRALLMLFRAYPDAGAVGSKLIYPDLTLQEAGGVIFSDGSGCNFGRGDAEIDAPLYNYVREVDYCSGASLATRRDLFTLLGGFDTRFAPAYYEDVDYCFQMRSRGYRVYYQPESVVIHCEGVSSGTDITRGVKSYQVVNQRKFVEKWRDALREQPSPPDEYSAVTWHALAVRGEGLERDANSHEARPGVRAARAGV
ncbi:MAG TPA: glycosyltransferase family 2 protein, partial [Thermomicrobiales bacterium]